MYSSPTRMRVERETSRRGNAPVVITTLLSLFVVGAAVAVVAYLVLRTPSSAVDSAERLEPIGTALPAPTDQPSLPTVVPTTEPDPEPEPVLGFTGEAPAVNELPTVPAQEPEQELEEAVAQDAGPTPTPRLISLPTAVPPTLPAAAPTLPPPAPVAAVPVVALEPVEAAAPPPAAAPATDAATVPAAVPTPEAVDDDPFNIFEDGEAPRIVPSGNDAVDRVREIQDEVRNRDRGRDDEEASSNPLVAPTPVIPVVVPTISVARGSGGNGSVEIIMPDVDAMIEEITARATDPNRNPNVGNAGRSENDGDDDSVITDRDDDNPSTQGRRKSARERINERNSRKTPTANGRDVIVPNNETGRSGNRGNQEDCEDPFANLPEDMRPDDFPLDNC